MANFAMSITKWAGVVFLSGVLPASGRAHDEMVPIPDEYVTLLRQLNADESLERQRSFELLRLKHRALVRRLVTMIDRDKPNVVRESSQCVLAAKLLSEFGAREAIPVLVRRIENVRLEVLDESLPIGLYPYAGALSRFGSPAGIAIIGFVRSTDSRYISDRSIELYTAVFTELHVSGSLSLGTATRLVEEAIKGTPNQDALNRLRQSIVEMSKTYVDD